MLPVPAVVLAAAAGALFWFRHSTLEWGQSETLNRVWSTARHALRALPPRAVLRAFVLTVPSWLLESVVVYGAAHALGLELSLTAAAAVTAFTILFQVVHLTPGGSGVYEASMTVALQAQGMPGGEALTLAVLTHGLKFAYAFGPGALLGVLAVTGLPTLSRIRASREDSKRAGQFEIVAARLWNVLNEGKPFTPVFVLGLLVLLGLPHLTDGGYWTRQAVALAALTPLFVVFYRYAFPLHLRGGLWVALAVAMVAFRVVDVAAIALVLATYLGFTVVLWGSIYYHLRIGTAWTNGFRFWRLVLENPDPTSGNFLEQVPKVLILVLLSGFLVDHPGPLSI
ncbi:MAG: flippase-like domain-containing protein, partial [Chloroflexi bacterium]|nr:flippase-like domain-containing protein [Chloroflexota bacterium]